MSLVSLQSDTIERRVRDGARIIYEDYTYRAKYDPRLSPRGQALAEFADLVGTTPQRLIDGRRYLQEMVKRCDERLAREMTTVYALNEQLDVMSAQHLPKGEAAEKAGVMPGELLDLDDLHGGLLIRRGSGGRYIFLSDTARDRGLEKYGPKEILSGLIEERMAA